MRCPNCLEKKNQVSIHLLFEHLDYVSFYFINEHIFIYDLVKIQSCQIQSVLNKFLVAFSWYHLPPRIKSPYTDLFFIKYANL